MLAGRPSISHTLIVISPISNAKSLPPLNALNSNLVKLGQVMKRLATGRRINSGQDDPADLIATERLSADIRSLEAESRSLARAEANAAIADGHTAQLGSLYADLNGLVVAGANDAGLSDAERNALQLQIDDTVSSINRFSGEAYGAIDRLSMPNDGQNELTAKLSDARAAAATVASGGSADLNSGDYAVAQASIATALDNVATVRGTIGTYRKNVVAPRIRSNAIAVENLTSSRSVLLDTDYASETNRLAQTKVLVAANRMSLVLGNGLAGSVLDLLA